MFELLDTLPPDPILGLMGAYRADPHPQKIDLGVGVYRASSWVRMSVTTRVVE